MTDRRAVIWLAAAILLFHWRALFHPGFALPWDMGNYHLPLAAALADSMAEGEFPYWEPYSYCGRPLAANPQAAVFYPTVALAAALGRNGLLDRLEWNVVLHIWLGGWFAYRLARRRGLESVAALCAGLIYSLGGFFASQVQHMGAVMAAAWLPLAWEGALFRSRWRVTTACFFAILAGFTPMTLVVLSSTLLLNWRCAGAVASAVALAAFQLGPAYDLLRESVAQYRTDWIRSGGGLPWESLVSLVAPNWFGIFDLDTYRQPLELTHMYVFCGWAGLGLAIWGARRQPALALLAGAFALAMLGETTPAGRAVFALMPQLVQGTWYWYPFLGAFTLCMGLLAGSAIRGRGVALALAITAELTLVGSGRPMNSMSLAREPELAEADVRTVRAVAGEGRIDTIGNVSSRWSTAAPLTHLPSANGYDPLALERLIRLRLTMAHGERWGAYYPIETPSANTLAKLGVSAVIAREPGRDYEGLRRASETIPGYVLYRVASPAPRVHASKGDVTAEFSRNRVCVHVASAEPTSVVISDAFTEGWQASIDGSPTAIHPADIAMRGVEVPAGEHELVVEIDRWRFWRWSIISFAVALALIVSDRISARYGKPTQLSEDTGRGGAGAAQRCQCRE